MTSLLPRISHPRVWLTAAVLVLVLALALATTLPALHAASTHLPAQPHQQLACGATPFPC